MEVQVQTIPLCLVKPEAPQTSTLLYCLGEDAEEVLA